MNLFDVNPPAAVAGQRYVESRRGKTPGVYDAQGRRFSPFQSVAGAVWATHFCNVYASFAAKIEWDELQPGEVL